MIPGTLETQTHYFPYPWAFPATDSVLNAVIQLIGVLLLAMVAVPHIAPGTATHMSRRWFWVSTGMAMALAAEELILLWQLVMIPENRYSLFVVWLFAFVSTPAAAITLRMTVAASRRGAKPSN